MSAAVKGAFSSWRMCGLASMYPAFDWRARLPVHCHFFCLPRSLLQKILRIRELTPRGGGEKICEPLSASSTRLSNLVPGRDRYQPLG